MIAVVVLMVTIGAPCAKADTLEVPLDHFAADSPDILLGYALPAPYDPSKPVVIVVADAQQFYVRADRMERIRDELFGDEFNIVGIEGRGASAGAASSCRDDAGTIDWHCAYRVFRARQWIEDIDAVRRELVGDAGKVLLFGQSGGAYLLHQYLAVHGQFVERAITPAAVNPFLESEIGINSDHFWEEIGAANLHETALAAVRQFEDERPALMAVLQRQNFFHSAGEIDSARRELLEKLARGDRAAFDSAKKSYQVTAVEGLLDSDRGISVRVRLWEFYAPSPIAGILERDGIYPDHENTRNAALPLITASEAETLAGPTWDRQRLRQVDTEVLVLAGRFDHTVDYRTSIALTHTYPFGTLLIVRDNHTFDDMKASGLYRKLIRTFLGYGADSTEFRALGTELERVTWRE